MKRYQLQPLWPEVPDNPSLSHAVRSDLEGAGQSFKAGAPLVLAGGFLVEPASAPVAGIVGIAIEDGHDTAAVGERSVRYIPLRSGLLLYGNLLTAAGGDHVLAAANVGTTFKLVKDAATGFWFVGFEAAPTDAIAKVWSLEVPQPIPNESETRPVFGDTNARVAFSILASARALDT